MRSKLYAPFTMIVGIILNAAYSQVVDVDGDGVVGAPEVIAVAEEWKQEAKATNSHDHLGQTWVGQGFNQALEIKGDRLHAGIPFRLSKTCSA